ncbi:MAG: hypothetical protein HC848_05055, partial [Limnobacter sp.]|nr:hypothetical protein [Limnobacter sp.]
DSAKRVVAQALSMARTRLELAGVELSQARRATVQLFLWALLSASVLLTASVFVCLAIVVYAWEHSPILALLGCASFYVLLGLWGLFRVKTILETETPLFEATLSELQKDREGLLHSLKAKETHEHG